MGSYGIDYRFIFHSYTKIIPLDEAISLNAADLSIKFGLGVVDSIIIATAKYIINAKIITSDEHFKKFDNCAHIE